MAGSDNSWKYDLNPLFKPSSVAVVGVSGGPKLGMGGNALKNLLNFGYKGKVYPINPKYDEIEGVKCYKSLSEIEDEVDLVLIAIPSAGVLPVLAEAGEKHVKAAIVFTSGFAETGPEGLRLQREIIEICEKNRIRLSGPNNMGMLSFIDRVMIYSAHVPEDIRPGGFAFVGQSGSVTMCALAAANARGLGCSYLITSGNEAVLESADYFHYLLNDPHTKVIGAFIESFKNAEKLKEVADLALEKGKPLIVLKVGRSQKGSQAARSHTGSLTGLDLVQDAFFRQKGIIRVDGIEELVETADLFLKCKLPKKNSLVFTMISGGGCGIVSDICDRYDLKIQDLSAGAKEKLHEILPAFSNMNNPLDLTGVAYRNPDIYYRCVETLLKEDNDIICMDPDIPWIQPLFEKANEFSGLTDKLLCIMSLSSETMTESKRMMWRESKVPILQDPVRGLKAISSLVRFSDFVSRKKTQETPLAELRASREEVEKRFLHGPKKLNELESKELLKSYGIPTVREGLTVTAEEGASLAAKIGYPVVLKILSRDILHKTEIGGVSLNIRNEEQLRAEYERLLGQIRSNAPDAAIDGILVQEMIPGGIEFILGMSQDVQFGPYIVFGLGGVYVEALKDVSIRVAPVSRADAHLMIRELRSSKILEGFRGRPPVNVDNLAEIIARFSRLSADLKDSLAEIDVNPLIVNPEMGCIKAVDALVLFKE